MSHVLFVIVLVISLMAHSRHPPSLAPQLRLQLDDPQDSTAVHFCGGIVGTILNGMFAKPVYVSSLEGAQCGGFIYTSMGGRQLGTQLLGEEVVGAVGVVVVIR